MLFKEINNEIRKQELAEKVLKKALSIKKKGDEKERNFGTN